jgi:hypothetical protein
MKLTKEDIRKYGTEEEKLSLQEAIQDAYVDNPKMGIYEIRRAQASVMSIYKSLRKEKWGLFEYDIRDLENAKQDAMEGLMELEAILTDGLGEG